MPLHGRLCSSLVTAGQALGSTYRTTRVPFVPLVSLTTQPALLLAKRARLVSSRASRAPRLAPLRNQESISSAKGRWPPCRVHQVHFRTQVAPRIARSAPRGGWQRRSRARCAGFARWARYQASGACSPALLVRLASTKQRRGKRAAKAAPRPNDIKIARVQRRVCCALIAVKWERLYQVAAVRPLGFAAHAHLANTRTALVWTQSALSVSRGAFPLQQMPLRAITAALGASRQNVPKSRVMAARAAERAQCKGQLAKTRVETAHLDMSSPRRDASS